MLADPTAFKQMKITASRDIEVGFELEPIAKKTSLLQTRLFTGYPRTKNIHNDYAIAQRAGLRKPIIMGNQIMHYMGEVLLKFFGEGYPGGHLSAKFIGVTYIGDVLTIKGTVIEKVEEGDAIRLVLDMWAEKQGGEKVTVATASGLVY